MSVNRHRGPAGSRATQHPLEVADDLAAAARLVIERWSSGDLAAAVRALDRALEGFERHELGGK